MRLPVRKSYVIGAALAALALGAQAQAADPVVLKVYTSYDKTRTAVTPVLDDYFKQFEALNPGIKIEDLGAVPAEGKLVSMISAGEAPDIVQVSMSNTIDFARAGLLSPVPEDIAGAVQRDYFPIAVQGVTYQGRLIGLPMESMDTALLYNRDLLDAAGVGDVPTNWSDFAALGRKISQYDPSGKLVQPAVITYPPGWSLAYMYLSLLKAEGGQLLDGSGKLTLDAPPSYQALRDLTDALAPGSPYMKLDWSAFWDGKAPFALDFPWSWQNLKTKTFKYASTLIPAGSAGFGSSYYNHAWIVFAGSKHPVESWKLLRWLALQKVTNGTTPLGHISSLIGSLPMSRSDINSVYFKDQSAFLDGFLKAMPYATPDAEYMKAGAA
ncbi:MAG TPA: extracellular solute-binding protein, partial [Limnochordia bacterium]|nr:extracellular solute-binding protein [Limnochordia bacterium]